MTSKPSYEELEQQIRQLKITTAKLSRSEEKYQKLVEELDESLYHMSIPDGKYEYVSPSIHKIFGYTDKQMYANPLLIQKIIHPDFHPYFQEKWADLLNGIVPPTYEYKITDPEGNERWIIQSSLGIFDEDGQIVGIQGIIRDVTERIKTEQELEQYRQHLEKIVENRTAEIESKNKELQRSNQELEQFAYVASHDLQEPLRMVSSYTQLLSQRYGDKLDEKGHRFINYAVDGAARMQRLIEDLLSFSRVTTRGKEMVPVDCLNLVGHVCESLKILIRQTGAEITYDQLPEVFGDAVQLEQLFQNLISNAIKFRGERKPQIHIGCKEVAGSYQFSIQDNGIGIDEKFSDRIFIIFQRLHTREEYSGTGIGLSICKRIVERHGGEIWFASTPGEGTTFFFTLRAVSSFKLTDEGVDLTNHASRSRDALSA